VGTKPIDRDISDFRLQISDSRGQISDYCHEIEVYLCRKNDGHLIRVVGPSFELVSSWSARGVPLKVAFAGIDRYFERYYRNGPRRRPVQIAFCEADVLDVFDEWRRATGVVLSNPEPQLTTDESPSERESQIPNPKSRRLSLPEHLERVVLRLTSARANDTLPTEFEAVIDRVSGDLDAARQKAGGVRGEARATLIARLREIDADMLRIARSQVDEASLAAIAAEAEEEIAPFRAGMAADAYARAREAAIDLLVRERFRLPVISYL